MRLLSVFLLFFLFSIVSSYASNNTTDSDSEPLSCCDVVDTDCCCWCNSWNSQCQSYGSGNTGDPWCNQCTSLNCEGCNIGYRC